MIILQIGIFETQKDGKRPYGSTNQPALLLVQILVSQV